MKPVAEWWMRMRFVKIENLISNGEKSAAYQSYHTNASGGRLTPIMPALHYQGPFCLQLEPDSILLLTREIREIKGGTASSLSVLRAALFG
jgi:hypothetical protein